MSRFSNRAAQLVDAFSQFAFAVIVFFIVVLPLAPLLNLLRGREGIGWVLLTIAVMATLVGLVKLLAEPALAALDKIRRGQLLHSVLGPVRNVSAVLGIYGVFKLEYFLVHGNQAELAGATWSEVIWQFVTQL